jgi:hypothetical protein
MACLRLLTFFPLRPDLNVPFSIALISRATDLPAAGPYLLLLDDFFREFFFLALFFFVGIMHPQWLGRTWKEWGCRTIGDPQTQH